MAESNSQSAAQRIVRTLCDICEQEVDAKWFCVDCEENLCDGCKHVHLKSKKTKHNKVVTLKEARDDGIRKPASVLCDEHSSFSRDIYCCICESVICLKCLDRNHKSHEWKMVSEVLPAMTAELEKIRVKLTETLEENAICSYTRGETNCEYLSKIGSLKEEIIEHHAKISQVFVDSRDRLLLQLNQYEEGENTRHSKASQEYEENISFVTDLITAMDTELIQESLPETVQLLKELRNIKLLNTDINDKKDVQIPIFVPGNLNQLLAGKIVGHIDLKSRKNEICLTEEETSLTMSASKAMQVVGISKSVCAICPDDEDGAWIAVEGKTYLYKVDNNGNVILQSVDVGFEIQTAAMNNNGELFVIAYGLTIIRKLSSDGKTVSTFTKVDSIIYDICVTPKDEVVIGRIFHVCLANKEGFMIQQTPSTMNSFIITLTCSVSSLILGIFENNEGDRFVRIYSPKLVLLMTWDMNKWCEPEFKPFLLTTVKSYIYITDEYHSVVYVTKEDGSSPKCVKHSHGVPWSVASDASGRIWLGMKNGKIILLN